MPQNLFPDRKLFFTDILFLSLIQTGQLLVIGEGKGAFSVQFSSIVIELNVPSKRFSSIEIELNPATMDTDLENAIVFYLITGTKDYGTPPVVT